MTIRDALRELRTHLRHTFCRHHWKETGYWAEGKTFTHTVWYCAKCVWYQPRPMSDRIKREFFGPNGFVSKVNFVDSNTDAIRAALEPDA